MLKKTLAVVFLLVCNGLVVAQRRVIPVCPVLTDGQKLVGFEIKFVVSKDTPVKEGRDIDYVYWTIPFGDEKRSFHLIAFSGLNVGDGEPSRDQVKASRKVNRRYWKHDEQRGSDSTGTLRNGKRWRTFGTFGEVIWYHDVPAEAAVYFDRLIATACFLK